MQPNNVRFGEFITQLRKQKNLTQKQLAQKLNISDKVISKWERGQSFPDISLILPLGEVLGVSATELLEGVKIESDKKFSFSRVENLVRVVISFSDIKNIFAQKQPFKKTILTSLALIVISILSVAMLHLFALLVLSIYMLLPLINIGPIAMYIAWFSMGINITFAVVAVVLSFRKSLVYAFSLSFFIFNFISASRYTMVITRIISSDTATKLLIQELCYCVLALIFCITLSVVGIKKQNQS